MLIEQSLQDFDWERCGGRLLIAVHPDLDGHSCWDGMRTLLHNFVQSRAKRQLYFLSSTTSFTIE